MLSCLHFNENSARAQARTAAGELIWSVSYPKYKDKGTVKGVKVECTFGKLNVYIIGLQINIYIPNNTFIDKPKYCTSILYLTIIMICI